MNMEFGVLARHTVRVIRGGFIYPFYRILPQKEGFIICERHRYQTLRAAAFLKPAVRQIYGLAPVLRKW